MKRFTLKKKIAAAAAVVVIVGAGAGGAFAYWSSSGSGSGSVATGSSSPVTIAQDAYGAGYPQVALAPGGPSQPINFTVHNPGSGHEYVASLTIKVDPAWKVVGTNGNPNCDATDFAVTQPTDWVGQDIAPNASVHDTAGIAKVQLTNEADNQDACQNISSVPLLFSSN
jgi:predicted ribosomally synthesized peptide with SipW-like signal peptide